ncbi:MAG: excinuclease ABC subunit UvrA [Bacteroidales bacterium]|jgi:excinuclease ABC subunit A|nr:excinuclease ABC subunit UvrA [Bacteroidales bacterium]
MSAEEHKFVEDKLVITGARENNLKNISVTIPQHQLVVITGLSGSGKSSLAFETIYAEGQRRYMETFSAYARHFIGNLQYPNVDKVSGLNPVVSIEQKTVNKNPRSTVGTVTEVSDFLRLLFARIGKAYSYITGEPMIKYTEKDLIQLIYEQYNNANITLLAPVIKGRKGHYKELFENIRKQGFSKVRIDGDIRPLLLNMHVDRYKIHDIEIVIDSFLVKNGAKVRLENSLKTTLKYGKGIILVLNNDTGEVRNYSKFLMCPTSGISYLEPEPNTFSFNTPYGACEKCSGLGFIADIEMKKIIPNAKLSFKEGGIVPIGSYKSTTIFKQLEALSEKLHFSLSDPIETLSEYILNTILYGTDEPVFIRHDNLGLSPTRTNFDGVVTFLRDMDVESAPASIKKWIQQFIEEKECPECHGARLKKESLHFKIGDLNIAELSQMDISELMEWVDHIYPQLSERDQLVAFEILREIKFRLQFLIDVGIEYLTLDRSSRSLSGGEAQRIRLATQIGSQLVNVLYILDEPSIGLHQKDNHRLIQSLKQLRDQGNSVIVVEHDKDMMEAADFIVDIGPEAGINGGLVTAIGTYDEILKSDSLTAAYLNGTQKIDVPSKRRKGSGKKIVLSGATGNNLKNVTVEFPLGTFICITGVSGSGKSSLINETLSPILHHHFFRAEKTPLPYHSIKGLDYVDKIIDINQQPIGRTPRSNPATYVGVFDEIRQLFAGLPEAKIRGYKPGRFSFNVSGGRCETCKGAGLRTIEMNFLPDVYVTCEACNGQRYNQETLEIRYKGKNINDVLEMDIEMALSFFENIPNITRELQTMHDVGLGYIHLGQASTTLSGGEAQRVKLATELSKRDTGNTLYILDEPTTGLHFQDIAILLEVLNRLIELGNSIIVIEHNMDVIKVADYIIDMGLDGGKKGGNIIACGSPEEIIAQNKGYTAQYLKEYLNN